MPAHSDTYQKCPHFRASWWLGDNTEQVWTFLNTYMHTHTWLSRQTKTLKTCHFTGLRKQQHLLTQCILHIFPPRVETCNSEMHRATTKKNDQASKVAWKKTQKLQNYLRTKQLNSERKGPELLRKGSSPQQHSGWRAHQCRLQVAPASIWGPCFHTCKPLWASGSKTQNRRVPTKNTTTFHLYVF